MKAKVAFSTQKSTKKVEFEQYTEGQANNIGLFCETFIIMRIKKEVDIYKAKGKRLGDNICLCG